MGNSDSRELTFLSLTPRYRYGQLTGDMIVQCNTHIDPRNHSFNLVLKADHPDFIKICNSLIKNKVYRFKYELKPNFDSYHLLEVMAPSKYEITTILLDFLDLSNRSNVDCKCYQLILAHSDIKIIVSPKDKELLKINTTYKFNYEKHICDDYYYILKFTKIDHVPLDTNINDIDTLLSQTPL